MTLAPKKDQLLSQLENAVRSALRDKTLKTSDKIKVIEAGAKLLAIRHKIDDGGSGGSNFFAGGK